MERHNKDNKDLINNLKLDLICSGNDYQKYFVHTSQPHIKSAQQV